MKNKTLTICLFITIASITFSKCQAIETQFRPKVQFSKHIQTQNIDAQLRDIELNSLKKQEQIENYYQQRFEQLILSAETYAKKFTYAERMRWVEFIKMTNQEPAANNDLLRSGFLEHEINELHTAMLNTYSLNAMRDLLLDENASEIVTQIAHNNKDHSHLLREQAHKILTFMNSLQSQSDRLEKQWENDLAQLEEVESDQADYVLKAAATKKSKTKTPGTVTAILQDSKSYLAMINGKFVRQADTIKGIKVVKIQADKVVFRKMLKKWTQKLGQAPKEPW